MLDGSIFSKDGILHLGKKSNGLTCATFILAVFLSNGMELLLEEQWEHRNEDDYWHAYIVKMLEQTKSKYGISDTHIENIRREKGCVRFRPEEVAGSLFFKEIPVGFKDASKIGKKIVEHLIGRE